MAKRSRRDKLVSGTEAWIAVNARREAEIAEWQRLETELFARARRSKRRGGDAGRRAMPESRAMQKLDVSIKAALVRLRVEAERLAAILAKSMEGALAKMQLGLEVQGPFDWQPNAQELLRDGLAELRDFVR